MTKFDADNLAKQMTEAIPELQCYYDWHIDDYGEAFSTLFLGILPAVLRRLYIMSQSDKYGSEAIALMNKIIDYIEQLANSENSRIADSLATGFIESMWLTGNDYDAIAGMLGEKTKKLSEN